MNTSKNLTHDENFYFLLVLTIGHIQIPHASDDSDSLVSTANLVSRRGILRNRMQTVRTVSTIFTFSFAFRCDDLFADTSALGIFTSLSLRPNRSLALHISSIQFANFSDVRDPTCNICENVM